MLGNGCDSRPTPLSAGALSTAIHRVTDAAIHGVDGGGVAGTPLGTAVGGDFTVVLRSLFAP
jgi:hypothetical protein